jgi:hypothetical protein
MQKNIAIITAVVAGIIILFAGFYIGTLVSSPTAQKTATIIQKDTRLQATIKALSSKLVVSSIAQGNVTKISGNTLTLSNGTDSADILISDNTSVFSIGAPVPGSTKPAIPTKVNFLNIKVGDLLNVNIQVSASGDIQGTSITIIPPLPVTAPAPATKK